jgi:hypothetical protein
MIVMSVYEETLHVPWRFDRYQRSVNCSTDSRNSNVLQVVKIEFNLMIFCFSRWPPNKLSKESVVDSGSNGSNGIMNSVLTIP